MHPADLAGLQSSLEATANRSRVWCLELLRYRIDDDPVRVTAEIQRAVEEVWI